MPSGYESCRRCPRKTTRSYPCKAPETRSANKHTKAFMVFLLLVDEVSATPSPHKEHFFSSFFLVAAQPRCEYAHVKSLGQRDLVRGFVISLFLFLFRTAHH